MVIVTVAHLFCQDGGQKEDHKRVAEVEDIPASPTLAHIDVHLGSHCCEMSMADRQPSCKTELISQAPRKSWALLHLTPVANYLGMPDERHVGLQQDRRCSAFTAWFVTVTQLHDSASSISSVLAMSTSLSRPHSENFRAQSWDVCTLRAFVLLFTLDFSGRYGTDMRTSRVFKVLNLWRGGFCWDV